MLGLLTSPVRQDRFIATAQLGITLASLGLGMYGEHTMAAWLEPRLELRRRPALIAAHTLASILAIGGAHVSAHFPRRNGAEGDRAVARRTQTVRARLLADARTLLRVLSVRVAS